MVREHLALDSDHLYGEASRRGDVIGEDVSRVGREAHHGAKCRFVREESLAQHLVEAGQHGELRAQQAVTLGMNTAYRVALTLTDLFGDVEWLP